MKELKIYFSGDAHETGPVLFSEVLD